MSPRMNPMNVIDVLLFLAAMMILLAIATGGRHG